MAVRLSVGLCALFGLLSGCATGGKEALSPNTPQTADALQTACESGQAVECYNLGISYANGHGVPMDEGRAATLFEKACTGGYAKGCFILGLAYVLGRGVPKDELRALTLFEKACSAGMSAACARR